PLVRGRQTPSHPSSRKHTGGGESAQSCLGDKKKQQQDRDQCGDDSNYQLGSVRNRVFCFFGRSFGLNFSFPRLRLWGMA
ncbi:MAG: hypothetical protein ACOC41_08785, partial [Chitinivibrionales bacterium]